ncbi:hypothetical protein [Halopelagius longus]|uniref:DUF3955 domain-containing protein n=1 Tax=Halopelagius longus TaxID=1236180 RepID=A0A1H1EJ54_9EURY|nr:hypothetical protein [Halopelagius longus]RDI71759.1 hypothetical protein DWB78_08485 [Halopelagius longus]SDQ88206.1 hypothetical protein SAMN05216278_2910 [Halopelagius longus]
MPDGPAADSLRYALNPELLKLYGVTYLGYLVAVHSQNAFHIITDVEPWESLVELPFVLCGIALFLGGLVGIFHRVRSDTTRTGRR